MTSANKLWIGETILWLTTLIINGEKPNIAPKHSYDSEWDGKSPDGARAPYKEAGALFPSISLSEKIKNEENGRFSFQIKITQEFQLKKQQHARSVKKGVSPVIWLLLFRFYCESLNFHPLTPLKPLISPNNLNFQVKNELPNRMATANDSFTEESSSEKVE